MDEVVKRTIENLDASASEYGYSADEYGYSAENYSEEEHGLTISRLKSLGRKISTPRAAQTNYSINPRVAAVGSGASTFKVDVLVKKMGIGSRNSSNPVFLFGPNAILGIGAGAGLDNTVGYLSVKNAGQRTRFGVVNGKNVLTIFYGDDINNHTYIITLGTEGEYPFFLGTLTKSSFKVKGVQIEISDSTQTAQLSQALVHFELNAFGKSQTNDLTTPRDLYQQQPGGVFIPHQFEIGPNKGLITNVLAIDGFTVSYYFYIA
ncbi:MAG: hypothetical protein D6799_07285 [Bacteroidetes bacterium]|nr:MAG: hypothetical protein D6799_07285 [Bacteroidota bacterium]